MTPTLYAKAPVVCVLGYLLPPRGGPVLWIAPTPNYCLLERLHPLSFRLHLFETVESSPHFPLLSTPLLFFWAFPERSDWYFSPLPSFWFSRLRVFENRVLRRVFGPKRDEVTGEWRKLHNEELSDLYSLPNIVRVVKSRRMRWAGHVTRMGKG